MGGEQESIRLETGNVHVGGIKEPLKPGSTPATGASTRSCPSRRLKENGFLVGEGTAGETLAQSKKQKTSYKNTILTPEGRFG